MKINFFFSTAFICAFLQAAVPGANGDATLKIVLDYRFDGGHFSKHEERRIPLEYAAGLWQKVLTSPKAVKAGTQLTVRSDFTTDQQVAVTYEKQVEGFVIFIYAHDFGKEVDARGKPAPSANKAVGGFYNRELPIGYLAINTHGERPWYFDTSPETEYDVPVKDYYDLITTAVHEMGHVLGFLRSRQVACVKSYGDKDERFSGPAVLRVNNGNPVPLDFGSSHIRGDWWNSAYLRLPPIDRHVMHTGDPVQGYRQLMTPIDLAVMEDIGWKVNYDAIPPYPYAIRDDVRKADAEKLFGMSKTTVNPVGLWLMDKKGNTGSAIVGYPLRYSPPEGASRGIQDLFVDHEIRVPKGGWLYCVPQLNASGRKGRDCNRYTLLFDVNLPTTNTYYCLFNTNPDNGNDGDCFVNPAGYFGAGSGGYRTTKLEAHRWYRLGIVVDADRRSRRYYIDGRFSHEVRDVEIDDRFAINSVQSSKPYFCLFGDDDGEDGTIDARRIILYDRPLTDAQMEGLGDTKSTRFGL